MTQTQCAAQVVKGLLQVAKALIAYFVLFDDFKDEFKFDTPPTLKPRVADIPRRIGGSSRQRPRD